MWEIQSDVSEKNKQTSVHSWPSQLLCQRSDSSPDLVHRLPGIWKGKSPTSKKLSFVFSLSFGSENKVFHSRTKVKGKKKNPSGFSVTLFVCGCNSEHISVYTGLVFFSEGLQRGDISPQPATHIFHVPWSASFLHVDLLNPSSLLVGFLLHGGHMVLPLIDVLLDTGRKKGVTSCEL